MTFLKLQKQITLTIFLLLTLPLFSTAQDSTALRLKLKVGQAFNMFVCSDMQMDLKMDDTTLSMNMEMEQRMRYNVFEVRNNGDIKLGTTPKTAKLKMSLVNGLGFEYDSANPDLDDPTVESMHDAFSTTIGKTINMTMSPLGKVTEYYGLEQYFEELVHREPGTDGLKGMLNDQSLKGLMAQFSGLYPTDSVKIGDTWKANLGWKQFGMDIAYDYTLLDVKDGVAKIRAKGKMDIDLAEVMENMTQKTEEMGFEYEITGSLDSFFELNAVDGWMDNMVQNIAVTGFVKMKLAEGASLDTVGMYNVMMDENGKVVIPIDMKLVQMMKRK
jgi:hypothetical protein